MGTTEGVSVVSATQPANAQQAQDGLPVWTIYRDPPGSPNLAGPRTPGAALFTGQQYNSYGIPAGTDQNPTLNPQKTGLQAEMPRGLARVRGRFNPPPQKVLWEPAQYVPGQGWVTLADVAI